MLIGMPLSPQGIIAQERHIQLENSVSAFLFQKAVLAGPGQPAPHGVLTAYPCSLLSLVFA